jgi:Zn-dependent protease with chaperone function
MQIWTRSLAGSPLEKLPDVAADGECANTSAMRRLTSSIAILLISAAIVSAQTEIKLPKNRYKPEDDVKLGKEAAAEVRQQYPVISDARINAYLTALGDRLVAAAPAALKQPAYEYSFTPVNLKEINAFALPGGPMFVNRGMFDAAAVEAEVVGVMAHELSHVLLRHGTANISKAQNPWLQLGQIAGAVGGAMVGGSMGSAIAQGSQFGLGAMLLRYSRDFEKQADLLGAQIMARAGYDPRALAHMFETIEKEAKSSGGSGNPQWLSSHPNPGNRSIYINKEADALTIATPADQKEFTPIKTAFASLPAAKSMNDPAPANAGFEPAAVGTPGQPVPAPATQYRSVTAGKVFQASVPSNWTAVQSSSAVKFVPENGFGPFKGETIFSHGVEFGMVKANTRDLAQATKAWLQAVAQSNPELRLAGEQRSINISQRSALATPLVNASPLGGRELIGVYTTFLVDGTLFYYITVVPEADIAGFKEAFQRIGESIRLTDAR